MRAMTRGGRLEACLVFMTVLGYCASPSLAEDTTTRSSPGLVFLAPGTRIGESAPKGWSDLVIKSVPKLQSGDVDSLPGFAGPSATMFRSVILADVKRARAPRAGFEIYRLGLGLCSPIKGVDTVVNSETGSEPPASLGLIDLQVLSIAEKELQKARLIARTATMAIIVAPSMLKSSERHQPIYLIYVILVDPLTGKVKTLLGSTAIEPTQREPLTYLNVLPPNLVDRCGLDVSATRLLGTLPVNWSFAMCRLPQGRRLATPASFQPWLVDFHRIAANPKDFERQIRTILTND